MGTLHYRFRIRNQDNTADALVFTSLRNGDNPYIAAPPQGDGATLNPVTGETTVGAYRIQVIDALGTVVIQPGAVIVTEGFEYANQAAAEAAGWSFSDTMAGGTITVGATDQADTGTRALKFSTTGSGEFADASALTASKTYDVSDGIAPSTTYRVTVRGRMSHRETWDANSWLVVNGLRNAITADGAWQSVSLLVESTADAELAVALMRQHAYVTQTLDIWWDTLTIESLDAEPETATGRIVTSALTDANARQQLLSRKAFIEESENVGLSWSVLTAGYVNSIKLPKATTYDFTIGGTRRIEQSHRVFDKMSDPVANPELIGVMDRMSCLLGGPIIGNFDDYIDRSRPVYRAEQVYDDGTVRMGWVSGAAHSTYAEFNPPLTDDVAGFLNNAASEYVAAESPTALGDGVQTAPCPGLVVRLYDVDSGDWVADKMAGAIRLTNAIKVLNTDWAVIRKDGGVYVKWEGTLPSVGDTYRLAVFPARVGPRSPIHFTGHPMDLLKYWYDQAGEDYDEVSRLAVRSALGDSLVVEYRVFEGSTLKDAAEKYVFAPFGVAIRLNTAGQLEFFRTRDRGAALPTDTITLNDLTSDEGTVWSLDEESAATKVVFESKSFSLTPEHSDSTPLDALAQVNVRTEVAPDEDVTVFGDREVTFSIPGHIVGLVPGTSRDVGGVQVGTPGTLDRWVTALAAPLFDWQGRGAVTTEISALRGATSAKIGDEIVLNLPHVPTPSSAQRPTSQRGTVPIIAQILQRTERPNGPTLKVQHRGVATSLGVSPTFTLAPSDASPRKAATVAITNEADLTVAGVKVAIEWATSSTEPVAGQPLLLWRPAVDDPEFDTPQVDAGSHIWVRMRAERKGYAPGTWTDWQDVDLADLDAPDDLAATVSGTLVALTWTNTEADEPIEVLLRLDTASAFDHVTTLPAGSTQYTLTLPDASTDYVIGVRYHEAAPFNGVSPTATVDITSGAIPTLRAPVDPSTFSDGAGTYGLEVTATEYPSTTVVSEAVETAVGSGTPGAYSDVASTASVLSGRTSVSLGPVPNDGKLRYLRARHQRTGAADSANTTPVSVAPWLAVAPTPSTAEPGQATGLTQTPIVIPFLLTDMPRRFWGVPSDRTVIAVQEKFPLGQFRSVRPVVVVTGTSLPDGAVVAFEFENPSVEDDWHPLDGDVGPTLAIDPTSLSGKLGKAVDGGYVTIRDEARDDVRLRAVLDGCDGDTAKAVAFTRIELQPIAQDVTNAPAPELTYPPPFDPGSCDTPSLVDAFTYANQGAAEAAGWSFT